MAFLHSGATVTIREWIPKQIEDEHDVSLETIEQSVTGQNVEMAKIPALAGRVSANNIVDATHMTLGQADYFYLYLESAGMTADKSVKPGDEFPLKWKSSKQDLQLSGLGKVLDITDSEIVVKLNLIMKVDGRDFGSLIWTSTHFKSDGTLNKSEGVWDLQGVQQKISIHRLDRTNLPNH